MAVTGKAERERERDRERERPEKIVPHKI
jgi:hypothetical protein